MNFLGLGALCWRFTLLSALWWAWLGHDCASWIVGAPAIAVSTAVSLSLLPPLSIRISPVELVSVAPKMVWRALIGGIDVARRVLSPSISIEPSMLRYPLLSLPGNTARWCFLHCVSLLPGTLSVSLEGDEAIVHVLANQDRAHRELAKLESDIASIFHHPSRHA